MNSIGDFIAELAARFPRHASEIAGWTDDYRNALQGLDAASLQRTMDRTMAGWRGGFAPRPADLVITRAVTVAGGFPLTKVNEDGTRSCTAEGFKRVYAIRRRMIDDALRHAGELTAEEARAATQKLWDRAWLAAQHEVITGTVESLTLTPEELEDVRSMVEWINRPEQERIGPLRRVPSAPPTSARQRQTLRQLADQHRASQSPAAVPNEEVA